MKLFLSAVLAVFLVGCGALPQKYDNNEYEMLVRLAVDAQILNENCHDKSQVDYMSQVMSVNARVIELYAKHTPSNEDVANVTTILKEDIVQLKAAMEKSHNVTYCKRKSELLYKKVNEVIKTVPKKLR